MNELIFPLYEGFTNFETTSRSAVKLFSNLNNYFMNLFIWTGLKDIEGFQLEEILNTRGDVAIFKIADKFIVAPIVVKKRNYLGYITEAMPIAVYKNFGQESYIESTELTTENAVFISNNEAHLPTLFWCWGLIKSYGELLDLYIKVLPLKAVAGIVPMTTATSKAGFKEAIERAFKNPYAIVPLEMDLKSSALGFEPFEVGPKIDTTAIKEGIDYLKNEIKELLGVKRNNNQDKKERLVVDEVNIENFKDEAIISTMLKMRQFIIKDLEEVFGLKVTVELMEQEEVQSEKPEENNENKES